MADTLDILTLAEAKTAINLDASVTTHDTELAQTITALSRRIDDLCGPVVQRTVTQEAHDGGCHRIWLRQTPVASVTTVTEYDSTTGTALTAESNASKPDDAYLLENRGHFVVLRRRNGNSDTTFADGRLNIEVTYTAGRSASTAAVDAKFKAAAAAMTRRLWKRESSSWATSPDYFGEVDDPRGGMSFFAAVTPMIRELLADELVPHHLGMLR